MMLGDAWYPNTYPTLEIIHQTDEGTELFIVLVEYMQWHVKQWILRNESKAADTEAV